MHRAPSTTWTSTSRRRTIGHAIATGASATRSASSRALAPLGPVPCMGTVAAHATNARTVTARARRTRRRGGHERERGEEQEQHDAEARLRPAPEVAEQFRAYRKTLQDDRRLLLERFEVVDMARKVVGVGSVGTRAFIVLLQGRDQEDPLFLQVKEATRSVLEDHLPKSRYAQPGERVVQGQRLMQAASDIFLGWTKGVDANRYLYWRQLRDMKGRPSSRRCAHRP